MNQELENKLFKRFNFYKPYDNPRESLMCFGFDCKDGWFDLIWELSEDIEKELQKLSPKQQKNFKVIQVKEKLAGLRFYTSSIHPNVADKIFELIGKTEEKSYSICEKCGKNNAKIRGGYWLKTLCDECFNSK